MDCQLEQDPYRHTTEMFLSRLKNKRIIPVVDTDPRANNGSPIKTVVAWNNELEKVMILNPIEMRWYEIKPTAALLKESELGVRTHNGTMEYVFQPNLTDYPPFESSQTLAEVLFSNQLEFHQ